MLYFGFMFGLLFSSASTVAAFHPHHPHGGRPFGSSRSRLTKSCSCQGTPSTALFMSDDWSNFSADDDAVLGRPIDRTDYAVEDDTQEQKAAVGARQAGPVITDVPTEPIRVLAGSQLELDEETVLGVLAACREELGTIFGYTAENRGVGITGGMDYVDMDGPSVVIRLKGRFWHTREQVLVRVANYLQQRIPEIVDVEIEDPYQLTNEANEEWE
jgi:hypothetical protein